ncbi:MAG TPA: SDR family oxidoreductase [Solirubrobacteraceae bacterium]|nr:SDR family oxidoreductase [Solirubrobacteraceae bacterium]
MSVSSTTLSGQTALVTGATGGLGRATALALARSGADVVIHGRSAERGNEVIDQISAAGGRAFFVGADVSTIDGAREVVDRAGDVDILVNNAGFSSWAPTAEFDVAQLDGMFASNIRAPFILVAGLAPGMARRGRGSIINVGSMAGSIGLLNGAAYGATKAALAALTRSWAAEYSEHGVRINTIAPGPIYTRPEAKQLFDDLGDTTAMRRAAQPEEIADVITFLASPHASYITGATIAADGGRTAI